jgi:hypothetical protein
LDEAAHRRLGVHCSLQFDGVLSSLSENDSAPAGDYRPTFVHNAAGYSAKSNMRIFVAMVVVGAVLLITLSACTRRWSERPLVGTYHLIHPTGCGGEIQDSTLVIRDDGTYDQHVQFKGGQNKTVDNGRWNYDRTVRRITFSKFLVSGETSFSTEPSHPAMIFVNRAGDCWYQHPK